MRYRRLERGRSGMWRMVSGKSGVVGVVDREQMEMCLPEQASLCNGVTDNDR